MCTPKQPHQTYSIQRSVEKEQGQRRKTVAYKKEALTGDCKGMKEPGAKRVLPELANLTAGLRYFANDGKMPSTPLTRSPTSEEDEHRKQANMKSNNRNHFKKKQVESRKCDT